MQFVRAIGAGALLLLFGTIVPSYAHQEEKGKQGQPPEKQQQARPAQQSQQQRAQKPQQEKPQPQQAQRGQQQQKQPQQQAKPVQQPQQQRAPQTQQQKPQPQQAQRGQPQQKQPQQQAKPAQQPQQQRAQQTQQQRPPQQARQQQPPQRTQQQAVAWQQQRGWAPQGAWQGHSSFQQGRTQHWETDHRTWAQRGGYGGYYIPQDRFGLYFGSQHSFRIGILPTIYMGYPRFSYGGFSFLLLDPWPESWAENWYAADDLYIDYDDGYYLYNRRYPNFRLAIMVEM